MECATLPLRPAHCGAADRLRRRFPRVRNAGSVLLRAARSAGGRVAMDALMVDITEIPEAQMWDRGRHHGPPGRRRDQCSRIARLKNSVSYDVLTNWRLRLRRRTVNGQGGPRPKEAVEHVVPPAWEPQVVNARPA